VVALNTALTPALVREGIAKDAIRLIQDLRKRCQCNFTDRIRVTIYVSNRELFEALEENREFISGETLTNEFKVVLGDPPDASEPLDLGEEKVVIQLEVIEG
jgi:isoleucyl-tRNA synthetase